MFYRLSQDIESGYQYELVVARIATHLSTNHTTKRTYLTG